MEAWKKFRYCDQTFDITHGGIRPVISHTISFTSSSDQPKDQLQYCTHSPTPRRPKNAPSAGPTRFEYSNSMNIHMISDSIKDHTLRFFLKSVNNGCPSYSQDNLWPQKRDPIQHSSTNF